MKSTQHGIKVGMTVTHSSVYGMGQAAGAVIAEAGTRYGRRYLWINYTRKGKTFNSAFWDAVLTPSSMKVTVRPPTTPNNNKNLWA